MAHHLPARLVLAGALLLQATTALAASKDGSVTVNCPVVGATIYIDGEEIGTVPMETFQLRFGNHSVRVVRGGLIAFEKKIMLRPGDDVVVNALPKEPKALLTIHTNERGGEVILDGKIIGPLPIKEYPTTPGNHSVFIRKPGLMPFKENFLIGPHREYIARPQLRNRDGSPASGFASMDLDLDDDLPAPTARLPPPKSSGLGLDLGFDDAPAVAPSKSAGFDLDLDMEPVAKPPPVKVASLDLSLDDDFALELPPMPAAKPAHVAAKPPVAKLPPKTLVAQRPPTPPPAVASFVADPIAEEEALEPEDTTPFYQRKWVWGATAGVLVAAVAIPVLTGKTGGYIEQRNPEAACADCLLVLNR